MQRTFPSITVDIFLQPLVSIYRYALEPIAPFTWFDIKVCFLELVAAFRLCVTLRQIKETLHAKHEREALEAINLL
ncbi:hypothetical protein AZE42_09822 [Rhizopogon vesiculosus]|uniref:Uncharacterized protein n=1 Tax=Rhizopogon vesiculosus TaxID=180088 RepID=A0A1J8QSB3_9AGAM|nr:hypothetical protein AZE42_09822 [Rhizopogon vesiculosus]